MEMFDFVFLVLTIAFFALSFWYVRGCEKL
jgi:hypothetical protein